VAPVRESAHVDDDALEYYSRVVLLVCALDERPSRGMPGIHTILRLKRMNYLWHVCMRHFMTDVGFAPHSDSLLEFQCIECCTVV
jgi:hypothetical protein